MILEPNNGNGGVCLSIGIFAWNEERGLAATLDSLFQQSLFAELQRHGWRCEVICVANGCTDRTPLVAAEIFERQKREHLRANCFSTSVANVKERGKINAWNQFVHALAPSQAQYLFMMDADILIHRPDTLWNMVMALQQDAQASISVDRPRKHILSKSCHSVADRLSLAASRMTHAAEAQLCGQLYCIRAAIARNIYLPRDLAACEDGFIKALVCTDFLTDEIRPGRIRLAEQAEHTFEAYTSPVAVLKNQKRQLIGQTIVHILVDQDLKRLPLSQRRRLAETIKARETADPNWLKQLIRDHLQRTAYFWELYPGLIGQHFRRLVKLSPLKRILCLPAAAVGSVLVFVASFMAYRSLKAGCTDYWPRAQRAGFDSLSSHPAGAEFTKEMDQPQQQRMKQTEIRTQFSVLPQVKRNDRVFDDHDTSEGIPSGIPLVQSKSQD